MKAKMPSPMGQRLPDSKLKISSSAPYRLRLLSGHMSSLN